MDDATFFETDTPKFSSRMANTAIDAQFVAVLIFPRIETFIGVQMASRRMSEDDALAGQVHGSMELFAYPKEINAVGIMPVLQIQIHTDMNKDIISRFMIKRKVFKEDSGCAVLLVEFFRQVIGIHAFVPVRQHGLIATLK